MFSNGESEEIFPRWLETLLVLALQATWSLDRCPTYQLAKPPKLGNEKEYIEEVVSDPTGQKRRHRDHHSNLQYLHWGSNQ